MKFFSENSHTPVHQQLRSFVRRAYEKQFLHKFFQFLNVFVKGPVIVHFVAALQRIHSPVKLAAVPSSFRVENEIE
jgi:hypothetical protein